MLDGATPTVVIAGAEVLGQTQSSSPKPSVGRCLPSLRLALDGVQTQSWATASSSISSLHWPPKSGGSSCSASPPFRRAVIRLMFNENVDVVVVKSRRMGHFDVAHRASAFVDEITLDSEVDFDWLRQWQLADQTLRLAAPVAAVAITTRDCRGSLGCNRKCAETLCLARAA